LVSKPIDTSSWPDRVKVILPSRAFLLSWCEQTVPTRRAAIEDATSAWASLAKTARTGTRDMALLAVIAEAMQPLEDLAYLATSWDEPFGGLANYVRATVYSAWTPSSFWQRIHKRDDDYFDVLAGFSVREPETSQARDVLQRLSGTAAFSNEQLEALEEVRVATRRRLRLLLGTMARDWGQFSPYYYAYKHGGVAANRDDAEWIDDAAGDHAARREPSIAVWHRARKQFEGRGEFNLSADEIVRHAGGIGQMAIDMTEAFVATRLSVFDAIELNDDGVPRALRPTQLPWTIWLREADLSLKAWKLVGAGPRINWIGDDDLEDATLAIDG
jgi:hypothetical protein